MRKIALLTFSLIIAAFTANAQTDSTADEGKLTFSGYIDSYYLHAFNNPKSGNLLGAAQGAGRAFDRLTDQFSLGLVQVKAMYSNKKSDMVIDLTFGPNAELGNFGNQRATTLGGNATGYFPTRSGQSVLYGSSIAIKQAYWTYKATSKLSFTVGQFGTHIGYEVIDAPVNYHYSLSNLFNNGPFYHIGAKANYAFSDNLGLMVGIVNNWDALTDWKKQKSFISQLYIKPVKGWNIYLNYIGGHHDDGYKIGPGPGTVDSTNSNPGIVNPFSAFMAKSGNYNRHLFDITTGYQITEKFYVGLNAAWGFYCSSDTSFKSAAKIMTKEATGTAKSILAWGGIAGYVNYAISDMFGIGVRYEHFQDKYGVRYIGATNNSLTITAPITLASGHLIIKPEFRMDTSPSYGKNPVTGKQMGYYERKDGTSTPTQTTLGCAFIYKY